MKRYGKTIAVTVLAVIIAVWILDKIPFTKNVDMQVEPAIYVDGSYVDRTTVTIKGEKTRYLFREDSFVGEIRIACLTKTDTEGLQAKIQWHSDNDLQSISFSCKGDFYGAQEYGLSNALVMSDDMSDFAFMTTDGAVISTAYGYCGMLEKAAGE